MMILNGTRWMDDVPCHDADGDLFFPPDLTDVPLGPEMGRAVAEIAENNLAAKLLFCVGCPQRARCAEYGWDEEYGIWGGLTPAERAQQGRPGYTPSKLPAPNSPTRDRHLRLFQNGLSITEIAEQTGSTTKSVRANLNHAWALAVGGA